MPLNYAVERLGDRHIDFVTVLAGAMGDLEACDDPQTGLFYACLSIGYAWRPRPDFLDF